MTSVVLNYGTPRDTLRAVRSLVDQSYKGKHRVIMIDNASPDDSRRVLEEGRPSGVELIISKENLGFGGGLNLVLSNLETDYAFILNSDAWCNGDNVIETLVARAMANRRVGVGAPKIIFDERWIRVLIESDVRLPILSGVADSRGLGVVVTGADVDGILVPFDRIAFEAGFYGEERIVEQPFRWTQGLASLVVPVEPSNEEGTISVYVMTDWSTTVRLTTSIASTEEDLEPASTQLAFTRLPQQLHIRYGPEDEVLRINNAGSHLKHTFHGSDRGFGAFDRGQFDEADTVFAFCGAAALLSAEALREVGVFDSSYFLYYEDTELSWRMQEAGYEIWFEPEALVRHGLSASTGGETSDLFLFHVWRNRLFMLTRHAPAKQVLRAVAGAVISWFRDMIRPHRPESRHFLLLRSRALGSYLRALPRLLRERT